MIYLFSIKVPNTMSLWCEGDYFIDTNKAGFDNGNNIYCYYDRWYLYDSVKKTYRTLSYKRNFDIDISKIEKNHIYFQNEFKNKQFDFIDKTIESALNKIIFSKI